MSMRSDQSAFQLEGEADEARRRLSSTLDDLADNLTPGRMLDEVISYSRGGGASFLKGLGNAASTNPLPTLLIGVGAAMLLSGKGRLDSIPQHFGDLFGGGDPERSKARRKTDPAGFDQRAGRGKASVVGEASEAVKDAVHSAASGVKSAVTSAASMATHAADTIGQQASSTVGTISDTASGLGDGLADLAEAVVDTTAEEASHLRDQAMRVSHDLRDRASRLAEEQPLVVAAAGIAIGALFAALLPRTSVEDELMGEASETIREAAGDAVSDQLEHVSSEAGNVADEVKETISQHGLNAKAAVDAVRDVGEKVSQAIS